MSEILIESLQIPLDQVGAEGFATEPKQLARYTVVLGFPIERAAVTCDLNASIDYGKLATELVFIGMNLPLALADLWPEIAVRYILSCNLQAPHQRKIAWARIEANGVALIERTAAETTFSHEKQDFGQVDIIFETDPIGVYRLNIAPGHSIPLHFHRTMREAELNLTEHLECQGRPLPYGLAFAWPHLLPHLYTNPLADTAKILCVDRPKFMPEDEVVTTADKPLTWLPEQRMLNLYQTITGAHRA